MTLFPFETETSPLPNIGVVVLQTDETIEQEFRALFPPECVNLYVSRIPSGKEVTTDTLGDMSKTLPRAASLFPDIPFDAIAYGCTSGASVIGPAQISQMIKTETRTKAVTDPVTALLHSSETLNLKRLAFLSPYIESVSQTLRDVLGVHGITTPVFGSFDEADDATVAKIDRKSIETAAQTLTNGADVDGLFMSCTNLKTLNLAKHLENDLKLPVLSSNLVLARHLADLTNVKLQGPDIALFRA